MADFPIDGLIVCLYPHAVDTATMVTSNILRAFQEASTISGDFLDDAADQEAFFLPEGVLVLLTVRLYYSVHSNVTRIFLDRDPTATEDIDTIPIY